MSAGWQLEITLDLTLRVPLWRQIADAITGAIQTKRLRPGERLPGARTLAARLSVHRHTVDAAYAELAAQGWVEGRQGSGTRVAQSLPAHSISTARRRPPPPPLAHAPRAPEGLGWEQPPLSAPLCSASQWLLSAAAPSATQPQQPQQPRPQLGARLTDKAPLAMPGGQPDVRLMPARALAQAYRRVLLRDGERLLTYGDPRGLPALREQLALMLTQTRGLRLDPSQVLVTRGSQMGLALAIQALIQPGDRVAVEAMGYQPAWAALRAAGATLVPIPIDAEGICTEHIALAHAQSPLRAVYVTPHHQYPTTALMSAPRRLALLSFAAQARVAILEDDYDHEFQYEGRPVLPLAASDQAGVVVYIGTLSKVLAPALRIGFLVGASPWIDALAVRRALWDRQGDQVAEAAVAELMESGELARHVRKMRRVYAERRLALADLLRHHLSHALRFRLPLGGMAIWAEVLEGAGVSAQQWALRAEAAGVSFTDGSRYTFDGAPSPFLRLGFACLRPDELQEAVRRMVHAASPASLSVIKRASGSA
jgi:GntR family transcriptional regulator / MocR family aminotransferase